MATPSAVPLAGGCSTSRDTIKRMEIPTASAYTVTEEMAAECGIRAQSEPVIKPTVCPPITRLGLAVMLLGMVKTMKAVAPIEAITTACSKDSSKRMMNITTVAKQLW